MSPSLAMLDHILGAWDPETPAVLGTLVDLQGSGYRRPGARILIQADGTTSGTISGGCLERDVARNAFRWASEGATVVAFDTRRGAMGEVDLYGTGCEGVVHLCLEPVGPDHGESPLKLIADARERREALTLVTAHHVSWPGVPLGLMAYDNGQGPQIVRAVSDAIATPLRAIMGEARTRGRTQGLHVTGNQVCRALVEHIAPPKQLLIVGTGLDAQILAQMAQPMGWHVTVTGRDTLALGRIAATGARTVMLPPRPTMEDLPLGPHTAVVLMSHNLAIDTAVLPLALSSDAPYVGLLGPRARTGRLMSTLMASGIRITPTQLARLATPIGLDLGGEEPVEVALSIIGQIVARSHGRVGAELVGGQGQIHTPHPITETRACPASAEAQETPWS
ncbi:MAG: XdhC family protein [Bradymonadia bacterium]